VKRHRLCFPQAIRRRTLWRNARFHYLYGYVLGAIMSAALVSRTLGIVPTYNEADNIVILVIAIFQATPAVDILFVDDHSQDGTQDQITRMQHQYGPKVHLLARAGKLGLGTAYIAGFQWALTRRYHVIVQMDADLSHDPACLPHFLRLLASADVVVGSRYVDGGGTRHWSIIRQCISKAGALYARWLLGLPIQDPTGGYNVWRRRVLEAMDGKAVHSEGYAFQIECKYRAYCAGFRFVEAPIVFIDRRVGASKMSTRIVLEAVRRTWQLRALRPQSILAQRSTDR
jgi:dolichol-phosphate mannosyltransferase